LSAQCGINAAAAGRHVDSDVHRTRAQQLHHGAMQSDATDTDDDLWRVRRHEVGVRQHQWPMSKAVGSAQIAGGLADNRPPERSGKVDGVGPSPVIGAITDQEHTSAHINVIGHEVGQCLAGVPR